MINNAVKQAQEKGEVSGEQLAQTIEDVSTQAHIESPEVPKYIAALRTMSHDAAIGELPEGVGGQFDGSITIASSTMEVSSGGVSETIAQMQEVYDHELYHALHHHTDAMMTYEGSTNVIIAGEGFTTTELVEGLTVAKTGEKFVSDEYKSYKARLLQCIDKADLTLGDIEKAVDTQKLVAVDDRAAEEEELVLAA